MDVEVVVAPLNSRILVAGVEVQAPVEVVWGCLTDYDRLQEFVPGLAENECLEDRSEGALLRQVRGCQGCGWRHSGDHYSSCHENAFDFRWSPFCGGA